MAEWDTPTGTGGAKLRLIVTRVSSDAATNTSLVNIQLQLVGVLAATTRDSPVVCAVSGTGGVSFESTFTWSAGTSSKTLIDITRTVEHNPDGTFSGNYAGSIGATGTQGIGGPTVNGPRPVTFPKLQVVPGTPTNVSAVRVSDTQVTVSWSQSSASNGQPTSNTLRRSVNGGAWETIGSFAPASSVGVTAAANQKIVYSVQAVNAAGASAWSQSSVPVFTAPAAPTGVSAARDASLDIEIAFTPQVGFAEHEHVIVHGTVSGGVTSWDASPLAAIPAGVTNYKHVAPNASDVHIYKVFARNIDTAALTSSGITSNSVQLLVAPNKPTLPAQGANVDKGRDFAFGWTHNAADTTAQTGYEVEYSANGGSSWSSTGKVPSATPAHTFPADTYASGQQLTLRVRTWGQAATGGADGAGASPWSDQVTVTFKTRPVATILSPVHLSEYGRSALTVALGFSQVEGAAFVRAVIELYQGATRVERLVSTTLASTLMASRVANSTAYEVRVTVQDSNGLVSDVVTSAFNVEYTEPVAAHVEVTFLRDSGIGQVSLTIPSPSSGEAEALSVTVTRTIDGETETIVSEYPAGPALSILDMTPTIHGDNLYAVTTTSAEGATSVVEQTLTTTEDEWAFMSAGEGYTEIVRFGGELKPQASPTVDSTLVKTAGRSRPIGLYGTTGSLVVSGTGEVVTGLGSSAEDIEAFLLIPGKGCYRDPSGRRMFGRITGQVSRDTYWLGSFTYTVTETS